VGAEIIPFPESQQREPACFICVNAVVGAKTYCTLYEELILLEIKVAQECENYEEDEDAT
jgi:hypothetical protein